MRLTKTWQRDYTASQKMRLQKKKKGKLGIAMGYEKRRGREEKCITDRFSEKKGQSESENEELASAPICPSISPAGKAADEKRLVFMTFPT